MALPEAVEQALQSEDELILITRGRRSGREHHVTLWFAYSEGLLWLRTDAGPDGRGPDWHRNLLRRPDCVVRVGGHELRARIDPLAEAEREAALRRLVELWRAKYGPSWVQDWFHEHGRLPVALQPLPA